MNIEPVNRCRTISYWTTDFTSDWSGSVWPGFQLVKFSGDFVWWFCIMKLTAKNNFMNQENSQFCSTIISTYESLTTDHAKFLRMSPNLCKMNQHSETILDNIGNATSKLWKYINNLINMVMKIFLMHFPKISVYSLSVANVHFSQFYICNGYSGCSAKI